MTLKLAMRVPCNNSGNNDQQQSKGSSSKNNNNSTSTTTKMSSSSSINESVVCMQKIPTISFSEIIRRANPLICLGAGDVEEPLLDEILPGLIRDLRVPELCNTALRCLYQLCDQKHRDNRIPMVCSSKWDVISPLLHHISQNNETENKHLSLLTLNNLSIPFENKAVMTLGHASNALIGKLVGIIRERKPEAYLCLICLVNLSYLDDAVEPILWYSPPLIDGVEVTNDLSPLENPHSLLRIIESIMVYTIPTDLSISSSSSEKSANSTTYPTTTTTTTTIETEATRWSCALIKLLSNNEKNADLISRTDIPHRVVNYLKQTKITSIDRWTLNSIEDSSLHLIYNLARWPQPKQVLLECRAMEAVRPVIGKGGIHDFRASIIRCCLES